MMAWTRVFGTLDKKWSDSGNILKGDSEFPDGLNIKNEKEREDSTMTQF